MSKLHLEHWWISRSELLALETLRASLNAAGIELTDDAAEADVCAALMPAQRVWEGLCGFGPRPLPLAQYLSPHDLQHRLFAPFRAVDSPSHLSLYGIPIGVSRCNTLWINKAIAREVGERPTDLEGFRRWLLEAAKLVEHPLGLGPEDWHVGLLFEAIILSMHGSEVHRAALCSGSIGAFESDCIKESLNFVCRIKELVSPENSVSAWHQAALDCQEGRSAAVAMGDWAHNEFNRDLTGRHDDYHAVCKWAVPGTGSTFLYNVDYIVPVERDDRATDETALGELTRALLSPKAQSDFGLIKGSHPVVRDAESANIDPRARKLFQLATISPNLFVPSMSLLQGSPRVVRDGVTDAVRELLYRDGTVEAAHAKIKQSWSSQNRTRAACDRTPGVLHSLADEHHSGRQDPCERHAA